MTSWYLQWVIFIRQLFLTHHTFPQHPLPIIYYKNIKLEKATLEKVAHYIVSATDLTDTH